VKCECDFLGCFSGPQREVYEALLEVQHSCIALCCPDGMTANQLYFEMLTLLGRQLQQLGLVPRSKSKGELQNVCRLLNQLWIIFVNI